jgi:hypothetical protein
MSHLEKCEIWKCHDFDHLICSCTGRIICRNFKNIIQFTVKRQITEINYCCFECFEHICDYLKKNECVVIFITHKDKQFGLGGSINNLTEFGINRYCLHSIDDHLEKINNFFEDNNINFTNICYNNCKIYPLQNPLCLSTKEKINIFLKNNIIIVNKLFILLLIIKFTSYNMPLQQGSLRLPKRLLLHIFDNYIPIINKITIELQ